MTLRELCGVFAVRSEDRPVAWLTYDGLISLQHRGQESAGIAAADGAKLRRRGGMGLVQQVFDETALASLPGRAAVGHVRYSTAGGSTSANIQPLLGRTRSGHRFALAHNGNLLAVGHGAHPATWPAGSMSDTHDLVAALGNQPGRILDALRAVLPTVQGAYSIAIAAEDTVLAARDPHGFRPLCLGRLGSDDWMVASETAALDGVGARFVREIGPGEILYIDGGGPHIERFAPAHPSLCVFEYVYFSRPDSLLGGLRVQQVRQAMGRALAEEAGADADIVVPVPETARPAALGYAEGTGIPYGDGLVSNNYVGRTFIRPVNDQRHMAARLKINPVPEVVRGRRVVVVDDSIVRANSARVVVGLLRAAGATQVHLRVASPPARWPCFFGVDIGSTAELPASQHSPAEIARMVGADTVGYLSLQAMVREAGGGPLCAGCFTGTYPVPVPRMDGVSDVGRALAPLPAHSR